MKITRNQTVTLSKEYGEAQGKVKMIISDLKNKQLFGLVELNKGFTHKDVFRIEFPREGYGAYDVLQVPVDHIFERKAVVNKDVYKAIDTQDFEALKALQPRSLTKQPSTEDQKSYGHSLAYALHYGTADQVIYLYDQGLRYNTERRKDYFGEFDCALADLMAATQILLKEDVERVWDKIVECGDGRINMKGMTKGVQHYKNYSVTEAQKVVKWNILFERTDLLTSRSLYDIRKQAITWAMYNGYSVQSKFLASKGFPAKRGITDIKAEGVKSRYQYLLESLKKGNTTVDELIKLEKEAL